MGVTDCDPVLLDVWEPVGVRDGLLLGVPVRLAVCVGVLVVEEVVVGVLEAVAEAVLDDVVV